MSLRSLHYWGDEPFDPMAPDSSEPATQPTAATPSEAVPLRSKCHPCRLVNNTVRCECGGQVAIDAVLRPLVDLGVGFRGRKFEVRKRYSKTKVVGYRGFCMKCHREGHFALPEKA